MYICFRTNTRTKMVEMCTNPPLLLLAEALCLLDRVGELLGELLVALVWRQVQTVEAGVRARKPRVLANLLNTEALRPIGAHELCKSAHWDTTGAADELQQARPLLVVHGTHKL